MLPPGKLLFIRWVHCSLSLLPALILSSFPSLFPAIGKNLKVKKCFSFCFEVFFSYRVNAKNQKAIATEKEEKHKPGKIPLSYLPGVCDYLFFTGRRLNHKR